MSTSQFLLSAWQWNPALLFLCAAGIAGHRLAFGRERRIGWLVAALATLCLALLSPIAALAEDALFSAHMLQHILLVLVVPAFVLMSLPRGLALPRPLRALAHPVVGWLAGVGAMWLWHVPSLCNAAATSPAVFALQTESLLVMGTVFWLQTLAPSESQRLSPLAGVIYLFSACTACSVLGIILTFSPVTVCTTYLRPPDRLGMLGLIRGAWGLTSTRDQEFGGLLMWVPMCLIYLAAIFAQLARWFRDDAPAVPPLPEKA